MFSQPFFIPSVIILIITLPLILGIIPPNRIYGVRTVETLSNEKIWERVNRYAGWTLLVSSLIYLSVAAYFPSVIAGETDFKRWIVHLVAFAGPLALSLQFVRRYINNRSSK